MRFLHTADLHLAKPFGRFDGDTQAALRSARLDALTRIGEAAQAQGASFILMAGDTFDAEAPPPKVIRRALDAMRDFRDVTWVLMPGNHDSLAAVGLWEQIASEAPENVILALTSEVIEIGDDVAILPAPPTVRNPGFDLTEWMMEADTGDRLRIGLAHGGIVDFGGEDVGLAVIPPDRAERSRLDYLALGDWHGQKSITPRTWYSGSPEADSFKAHDQAGALLIEITAPGATPQVTAIPTGQFTWHAVALTFFAGEDPVQRLREALPATGRNRALVRFTANGRLGLSEQSQLREECAAIRDDFHAFEANFDHLGIEQAAADLDLIASGGALRAAADSLFAATDPNGRTAEEVQIAKVALNHLFHLAQQEPSP